ncbi:hypothetical protein M758_2G027800 [Ceratodon purpureus]|nr:hypothetical protein M758_2G027800 [Ceratodon purpureus]
MFNMRQRIVLREKHKNPIRQWSDAHWAYDYALPTLTSCLITCLAIIPYNEDIFSLKDTIKAKWIALSPALTQRWPQRYTSPLIRLDLSPADRQNLLGHYPPENIPDIDIPWEAPLQAESSYSWSDDEQTRSDSHRLRNEGRPALHRDV